MTVCKHGIDLTEYCAVCHTEAIDARRVEQEEFELRTPIVRGPDLTVAVKSDGAKSRIELIDPRFIEGTGWVLGDGAIKYSADNWRKGFTWRRLIGALCRHIFAFARGEQLDPESGRHHLLHAACELMFLYIHDLDKLGTDDRIKP